MQKRSIIALALVVLILLSACSRGNDESVDIQMYVAEPTGVVEPEAPVEEPAPHTPEIDTATEEPAEPYYIWEIWSLAYVDVEAWRDDIVQFRNFVFRVHPKFVDSAISGLPQNIQMGAAFDEHLDGLLEKVPHLTKLEILIELQRAVALLEDNHFLFGAAPPRIQNPNVTTFILELGEYRYPLEFRWFYNGHYLYRSADNEDVIPALNRRLVAINDIPVENVFAEFTHFWSIENIYDARNSFALNLNSPGILYALGVLDGRRAIYTFLGDGGELITVNMTESLRVPLNVAAHWHNIFHTLLTDNRNYGELPLFLQNSHQAHWYTFIEEYGVLFIRINSFFIWYDTDFITHVKELVSEKGDNLRATIIDARNNDGGDAEPYQSLFDVLAEVTPPGKLFYFMNEGSLSASLLAGGQLYGLGATIVGQPSGQLTDFYAFAGSGVEFNISLRNTLAHTSVSNRFHTIRNNGVVADDLIFRPHILIEYTIGDWISNHDPYLEYVRKLLRNI